MKNYNDMNDAEKKSWLTKLYIEEHKSFQEVADIFQTYANKIRRDAIKLQIKSRNKSDAQKNALETGKHKHPTKGTTRSESTKNKIGKSVMQSWESLSDKQLTKRKTKSKQLWNNLSDDEKQQRLNLAHTAIRNSSKIGSKLEHKLLELLIQDGYKVDFHKEQILSNTKLQIDLFLPTMNIAIEVDGPSHFLPVWGDEVLAKNIKYDQKKTGLILGKGLKLIRIKQTHDFSQARSLSVYEKLIQAISQIKLSNIKSIEIED